MTCEHATNAFVVAAWWFYVEDDDALASMFMGFAAFHARRAGPDANA